MYGKCGNYAEFCWGKSLYCPGTGVANCYSIQVLTGAENSTAVLLFSADTGLFCALLVTRGSGQHAQMTGDDTGEAQVWLQLKTEQFAGLDSLLYRNYRLGFLPLNCSTGAWKRGEPLQVGYRKNRCSQSIKKVCCSKLQPAVIYCFELFREVQGQWTGYPSCILFRASFSAVMLPKFCMFLCMES